VRAYLTSPATHPRRYTLLSGASRSVPQATDRLLRNQCSVSAEIHSIPSSIFEFSTALGYARTRDFASEIFRALDHN
jgi:hypothetical protein